MPLSYLFFRKQNKLEICLFPSFWIKPGEAPIKFAFALNPKLATSLFCQLFSSKSTCQRKLDCFLGDSQMFSLLKHTSLILFEQVVRVVDVVDEADQQQQQLRWGIPNQQSRNRTEGQSTGSKHGLDSNRRHIR